MNSCFSIISIFLIWFPKRKQISMMAKFEIKRNIPPKIDVEAKVVKELKVSPSSSDE